MKNCSSSARLITFKCDQTESSAVILQVDCSCHSTDDLQIAFNLSQTHNFGNWSTLVLCLVRKIWKVPSIFTCTVCSSKIFSSSHSARSAVDYESKHSILPVDFACNTSVNLRPVLYWMEVRDRLQLQWWHSAVKRTRAKWNVVSLCSLLASIIVPWSLGYSLHQSMEVA